MPGCRSMQTQCHGSLPAIVRIPVGSQMLRAV
jgi:hypothetical protein